MELKKIMSLKIVGLASLAICLLALSVPLVMADGLTDGGVPESFSVYTDKLDYEVGETVTVYVKADSIDPNQVITVTDVIAYDPNSSPVAQWRGISIVLSDTTTPKIVGTFTAPVEGFYTVEASGTGCPQILRCSWRFHCRPRVPINVVPEFPFGTIAGIGAFLGATGLYVTRKKRPLKD